MQEYWNFSTAFYAKKLNSNLFILLLGRKVEEEKDTKIYNVHFNTSGLVSEYMHYFNDFPNKKSIFECKNLACHINTVRI